MFKREVELEVDKYLTQKEQKILFIWGPRRSGKTTLLKKIAGEHGVPLFNFDLISDREKFVARKEELGKLVHEHGLILIDEVQNYPESTVALKLLHDEFEVQIIATGSSELRQKSSEFDSLAGRFVELYCLPLSIYEIADNVQVKAYDHGGVEEKLKEEIQIFGAYPEVYTQSHLGDSERIDLLQNILDTYVLKDIISIYDLKNEKLARDILMKIALQVGAEVSVREIANSLQANVITVTNYIDIFIRNYVLIPLPSFKTKMRKAVSENRKLFFYDLGLRNVLVKDFRPLTLRPDKGGLFENLVVSEMEKLRKTRKLKRSLYFYREYDGKEVDLVVEDYYKKYVSVEIKVDGDRPVKDIFPLEHGFVVMDGRNYFEEIGKVMGE